VLVAIPITAMYIVFQRFLLEGLMAGANKGE
jgi:ABC-type maltose transport system permease subunit